jgi:hypothetical protein
MNARQVTTKAIQVHTQCVCGFNEVETQEYKVRYKDFKHVGIKIVKDKTVGKYFLLLKYYFPICYCHQF